MPQHSGVGENGIPSHQPVLGPQTIGAYYADGYVSTKGGPDFSFVDALSDASDRLIPRSRDLPASGAPKQPIASVAKLVRYNASHCAPRLGEWADLIPSNVSVRSNVALERALVRTIRYVMT